MRILYVGSRLPVEIQGSLPVKGDQLGILARQDRVFQCPQPDRLGHGLELYTAQAGILLGGLRPGS